MKFRTTTLFALYDYMCALPQSFFPNAKGKICMHIMQYRWSYSGGSYLGMIDYHGLPVRIFNSAVYFIFHIQSCSAPKSVPPFLEHFLFLQCFTVAVLNLEVLKTKHIFLHTLHLAYALPCLAAEPRDQGRYFVPSHHQFLSSDCGSSAALSAGIAEGATPGPVATGALAAAPNEALVSTLQGGVGTACSC